eukprot:354906-Chlamydomonas_euryale.AAC.8
MDRQANRLGRMSEGGGLYHVCEGPGRGSTTHAKDGGGGGAAALLPPPGCSTGCYCTACSHTNLKQIFQSDVWALSWQLRRSHRDDCRRSCRHSRCLCFNRHRWLTDCRPSLRRLGAPEKVVQRLQLSG